MKQTKRGRFGEDELMQIKNWVPKHGVEAVAEKLNRTVESVREHALKMGISLSTDVNMTEEDAAQMRMANKLMKSPEFKQLQSELNEDELEYFVWRYKRMMGQFKGDVYATEETTMFMLIKQEILVNRNMRTTKSAVEELKRMQLELAGIYQRNPSNMPMDPDDERRANELQMTIAQYMNAQQSSAKELAVLQKQLQDFQRELKATRQQRIDKIDNASKDFVSLLQALMDDDYAGVVGDELAMMKKAISKEKEKLSTYHDFEEMKLDKPLLTPETVLLDEEPE